MSVTPITPGMKTLPSAVSATIDQINAVLSSTKDHSTTSFLACVDKLQKIFMVTFPFVSFYSTVRDGTQRVTLAWDGLRIVVKKTASLPVPSSDEQWQALTGIAEDAVIVLKQMAGL